MRLIFVVFIVLGGAFAHLDLPRDYLRSDFPSHSASPILRIRRNERPVQPQQPAFSLQFGIDILQSLLSSGKLVTSVLLNPSNLQGLFAKMIARKPASNVNVAPNQQKTTVAFQLDDIQPDLSLNKRSLSPRPNFIGKPFGIRGLPNRRQPTPSSDVPSTVVSSQEAQRSALNCNTDNTEATISMPIEKPLWRRRLPVPVEVPTNTATSAADSASSSAQQSNAATSGQLSNASSSNQQSNTATSGQSSNSASSAQQSNAATSGQSSIASSANQAANAAMSGQSSIASSANQAANAAMSGQSSIASSANQAANAAISGQSSIASSANQAANAAISRQSSNAASSAQQSNAATSGQSSNAPSSNQASNAAMSGQSSNAASSAQQPNAANSGQSSNASSSNQQSNAATSGQSSNTSPSNQQSNAATSGQSSDASSSNQQSNSATSGQSSNASSSNQQSDSATSGQSSNTASSNEQSGAAQSSTSLPSNEPTETAKQIITPRTEVTNNNVIIRPVSVSGLSTIINPVVNVGNREMIKVAAPSTRDHTAINSPSTLSVELNKPITISASSTEEKKSVPEVDKKSLLLSRMALPEELPEEQITPSVVTMKSITPLAPTEVLPNTNNIEPSQSIIPSNIKIPTTVVLPLITDENESNHLSHIELGENESIIAHEDVENVPEEILKHVDLSKV